MKKVKITISILLIMVMLLGMIPTLFSSAENYTAKNSTETPPLVLWYDEEAPYGQEDTAYGASQTPNDETDGWERWSLPIGNGYFGANVFGRTGSERIQLSEKTLCNPYSATNNRGGLNNFSETYLDFNHSFSDVENYKRSLDINNAIASVEYTFGGVNYTREYFTSYEDYCMVIKLTADESGALSFTLRPTIPYLQDYVRDGGKENGTLTEGITKHGNVKASTDGGENVILLQGNMGYYNIDFVAEYRLFTDGNVNAGEWTHTYETYVGYDASSESGENTKGLPVVSDEYSSGVRDTEAGTLTVTNGTLDVSNATEAYIVITLGTNYDQSKGADNTALIGARDIKATDAAIDAHEANEQRMDAALAKSFLKQGTTLASAYSILKDNHVNDYRELFDRVSFVLEYDKNDLDITTDALLAKYKSDEGDGHYLEMLYYQYGRYLLIASSRENTLPANLQGVWNRYNFTPWSGGYWHNINVQMNYWHAFSANLSECFEAYVNYEQSYLLKAQKNAYNVLKTDPFNASVTTDTAGISIGIGATPYRLDSSSSCGELGFTTQMFWDYYLYTNDEEILRDIVYPILYEGAEFITKTVAYDETEDAYLSIYSYSPEQRNPDNSFYYTVGTTYDQSFAYLNNKHLIEAAEILGIEDDSLITEVKRQLDKYDAILIGYSGQIKEFREENYYGDIGEWEHRHISQLVALFPGESINSTTPAWLDAAAVTLNERGDQSRGWSAAHKLALWARVKNGERAHDLYESLLKNFTATNLWNLHVPYQIDGNFGGSAGVTEMLLQSHEGFVEPLAAIPASWANGSYRGLSARGGFTVDAAWANGSITSLTVYSASGGELALKAQNIASATVTDSNGNPVGFTSDGRDLIKINAKQGESYTVTAIPEKVTVSPAKDLTVAQSAKNTFDLKWQASADAISYNVYKAVEDAPAYELIASTASTEYEYTTTAAEENRRMTYKVCALGADGRESVGTLDYINPDETEVYSVEALALSDGSLQALIIATGDVKEYTLYEFDTATHEWVAVAASKYPVIVYGGYDSAKRYAVSATTLYFEGKLLEVGSVGVAGNKGEFVEDTESNAFLGAVGEFTSGGDGYNSTKVNSSYPLSNAFEGDSATSSSNRFGVNSAYYCRYTITVTLNGTYNLKNLLIQTYKPQCTETASTSEKTFIEVYADGKWTTVYGGEDGFRLISTKQSSTRFNSYFDMGFAKAEKVRFTFTNTDTEESGGSKDMTSIWEISSTYGRLAGIDRSALLAKIVEFDGADLSSYNAVARTLITKALADAKLLLADTNATADDINEATLAFEKAADYKPTVSTYPVDGQTDKQGAFNKDNFVEIVDGVYGNNTDVYKWTYNSSVKQSYWKLGNKTNTNKDVVMIEFDVLAEEGSLWRLGLQGLVDSNAYIMNLYFGNGYIKTDGKDSAISGNGAVFNSAGSTLCEMENNKWYRIAVVLPSSTEKHNTIYVYVNGEKYTLTTDSAYYYAQGYVRFLSDGGTCYLDNVRYTLATADIYNSEYDTPTVPENIHGAISTDGQKLILHGKSYTVSELSALLSRDISVMRGNSLLASDSVIEESDTVIILPGADKNSYTYYTVANHTLTFTPSENGYPAEYSCDGCDSFRLDFTPRISVTLHSSLILNIYIPDVNGIESVIIDGTLYDIKNAELADGYRRIRIPLASNEAFRDIGASITITHPDGKAVGRYTFSLVKYAEKILNGAEQSKTEKALVRDILAYVSSAYTYFGNEIPAKITALLGSHSTVFAPAASVNHTLGLKSASFVLKDTPSVRFYLDGSVAATEFTFTQNGRTLPHTVGTGDKGEYIEITLYAYEMIDTFNYTLRSSDEIYGFNLASYCEYLENEYEEVDRDELVDLGKKFYAYCASAAKYRTEIISANGGK